MSRVALCTWDCHPVPTHACSWLCVCVHALGQSGVPQGSTGVARPGPALRLVVIQVAAAAEVEVTVVVATGAR